MTQGGSLNGRPDIEFYKKKMDSYEKVFDAVIEDFNNSMFGLYANSVTRETFKDQLMSDGWKYFSLNNLNELFSLMYEKLVKEQLLSEQSLANDVTIDGAQNLSLSLIHMKDGGLDDLNLNMSIDQSVKLNSTSVQ